MGKVRIADDLTPLILESGQSFYPVDVAYETYGSLNKDKTNVILLEHSFSGDAHAAGDEINPGWWQALIGPGKAFDTDLYYIICSNVLGGCKGTTGPSSINPATGETYGARFPIVTISDMVEVQRRLLDELKINILLAVAGGSMGGMLALQWVAKYPHRVRSVIPIATTLKHSPQQIAFNEVSRQAITSDIDWKDGRYNIDKQPERGLALARMIAHITYMSEASMEAKFARKKKATPLGFGQKFGFEVESYLQYRGESFVKRFDANSYLFLTRAMDEFNLSGDSLFACGPLSDIHFLVISFKSDWLYPSAQSQELVRRLVSQNVEVTYCEISSTYGHDAFLIETDEQTHLIKHFLEKVATS